MTFLLENGSTEVELNTKLEFNSDSVTQNIIQEYN